LGETNIRRPKKGGLYRSPQKGSPKEFGNQRVGGPRGVKKGEEAIESSSHSKGVNLCKSRRQSSLHENGREDQRGSTQRVIPGFQRVSRILEELIGPCPERKRIERRERKAEKEEKRYHETTRLRKKPT